MGKIAKGAGKPRPGKTQTNRFSRVGPTLVAWIQAQEEGAELSLEEHFEKEKRDRERVEEKAPKGKVELPRPETLNEPPKPRVVEDETDESGLEESEACSECGETIDEEDVYSESSFAEKEADYGSSEDECYQIEGRRLPQVRPPIFRIRRPNNVSRPVNECLKEEEFVAE